MVERKKEKMKYIKIKKYKKAWALFLEHTKKERPYVLTRTVEDYVTSFNIETIIGWYILFFEDNGIITSVYPFYTTNDTFKYDYKIQFKDHHRIIQMKDFVTRKECWEAMIECAFKELERSINEDVHKK